MKTNFKQWLLGLVCCLAVSMPLAGYAEPYFVSNDGSMILDKSTNLVWQRCSVGQNWNGKTCNGEAQKFNFEQAKKLNQRGWRVPTISELTSLIYCTNGQLEKEKNKHFQDSSATIHKICNDNYSQPTINVAAFPKTLYYLYWSSSPNLYNSNQGWNASFYDGIASSLIKRNDNIHALRLVRDSQLSETEAELDFSLSVEEVILTEVQRKDTKENDLSAQNASAQKMLNQHFKTDVEILTGWEGEIQSKGTEDWAGVVRIKDKNTSLIYAVIALENQKNSKLEIVNVSRKGAVKECGADCIYVTECGFGINSVWFSWWTKKDDVNVRTTYAFRKKSNTWLADAVIREDWNKSGKKSTLVARINSKRKVYTQNANGADDVSERNGAPLTLNFRDLIISEHWHEKGTPL